eukprot:Sdes_comp23688_c0_seq1m21867
MTNQMFYLQNVCKEILDQLFCLGFERDQDLLAACSSSTSSALMTWEVFKSIFEYLKSFLLDRIYTLQEKGKKLEMKKQESDRVAAERKNELHQVLEKLLQTQAELEEISGGNQAEILANHPGEISSLQLDCEKLIKVICILVGEFSVVVAKWKSMQMQKHYLVSQLSTVDYVYDDLKALSLVVSEELYSQPQSDGKISPQRVWKKLFNVILAT